MAIDRLSISDLDLLRADLSPDARRQVDRGAWGRPVGEALMAFRLRRAARRPRDVDVLASLHYRVKHLHAERDRG